MVSALETLLNAACSGTFTVSYDNSTYKITIASTANFKILATSTCSWLGIDTVDSTYSTSYTLPKILNLSGPSSLYLLSSELTSNSDIHSNESINVLCKLPLGGSKGEVYYWENNKPYGWFDSNSIMSSISLRLVDADTLNVIDLNGSSFSITIAVSDDENDILF